MAVPQVITLDNGLSVILDNLPWRKAASAGIYLPMGSRFESDREMGYSHFTEHMLFKGTSRRNYGEIAREIDRLGGYLNASTSREVTNYYVTITGSHLQTGLEVLSDIFFNSLFAEEEFQIEKKVIMEEIRMAEDVPDDYLGDLFYEQAFADSPLGRPIAGTLSSIGDSTRDDLYNFYRTHYGPAGSVLSLSGALWRSDQEKASLVRRLEKTFSDQSSGGRIALDMASRGQAARITGSSVRHTHRDLEQMNFSIGLPGLAQGRRVTALDIFNHAIGGNMSSRLFTELREKKGLCYSIGSYHSQYSREGLWGIYGGTSEENFFEAAELALQETRRALQDLSEQEIREAKSGLRGMMELQHESLSNRSEYFANTMLYFGEIIDFEEAMSGIDNIPDRTVLPAVQDYWADAPVVITSLGPLSSTDVDARLSGLRL